MVSYCRTSISPLSSQLLGVCVRLFAEWTVVTDDGKRAAQFEHTVLITADGVEVLTGYDGETLEWDENEPI